MAVVVAFCVFFATYILFSYFVLWLYILCTYFIIFSFNLHFKSLIKLLVCTFLLNHKIKNPHKIKCAGWPSLFLLLFVEPGVSTET